MDTNTPYNNDKHYLLITGANGLLGQKLVSGLLAKDTFKVLATGRGKCRLPGEWEGYTYHGMDVTDTLQIEQVISKFSPRVVIHCASMTNVDRCEVERQSCFEQNVTAVANMVEACERHGIHLIYLSTDFIFDGENGPYVEDDLPHPINYYGETKLESENLIKASSLAKWAIVRTGLVYGVSSDMSRSNIVLWVRDSLINGKELSLVDDQVRTPTLAEDLAAGCILIAEKGATGVYNISGGDLLTPYDMAVATASFFNLDASKLKKVYSQAFTQTAKRPLKTGFIIDKANKTLGYKPRALKEGIEILAKQLNIDVIGKN